jgi:uncharacterized protein
MRAVCDANILISSLLWRGAPYECLLAAESGLFQLVLSEPILGEVRDTLVLKFGLDGQAVVDVIAYLRRIADVVPVHGQSGWVKPDPDDDKIVETAVAGDADCIVSGDRHLLDLQGFAGLSILTAREFLRQFDAPAPPSQE